MDLSMWSMRLVRPGLFEKVTVPVPELADLQPGTSLVKIRRAGICGSDTALFRGRVSSVPIPEGRLAADFPGFPLHEIVCDVVGGDDPALPAGTRAVGWAQPMTGLAEYTVTTNTSLMPVPEGWDDARAVTVQPLGCVVDTVRRIGDLRGLRVGVVGMGPFGLLFSHVAKAAGAEWVVGVDPVDRLDVAGFFGVDEFVNTPSDRWARSLTDEERPHLIIEAVGHQASTLADAVLAVRNSGTIFYFGVPDDSHYVLPMQQLFRKDITLRGGTVLDRRGALRQGIEYLSSHPEVHDLIATHEFPVERATDAYAAASSRDPRVLKVQLSYP